MKKKKRLALKRIAPAVICYVLIAAVAWALPLRPSVSEREKRNLETFPEFSFSSLVSGDYFEQIGLWFSDTFPFRDKWIDADQSIEKLYGNSDIVIYGNVEHGDAIPPAKQETLSAEATEQVQIIEEAQTAVPVQEEIPEETQKTAEEEYVWGGEVIDDDELVSISTVIQIGDSAYAFTAFSQYYSDAYAENITRASELLDGKARVFDVLVLHSTTAMLPREYRDSIGCDAEEDILEYVNSQMGDKVYCIDTFTPLLHHNSEYVFYHTDHHWTQLGAWYVYEEWARQAGFEPVPLSEYTETVQSPFLGSLYYKANQSKKLQEDEVYTYSPPDDVHLFINLGGQSDSVDFRGYEEKLYPDIFGTDKYMAFLTGDHPLCTFVNNDITDGSACLLVKNSNGNPFSYFLSMHYQYVYVMDYRKYFNRSLTDFVDYYDVDDVIFCLSAGQAQSRGGNDLLKAFIR